MAIRFECEQCGSVLKIKDDLAGKPGKCPKCKTAFTVPTPDDAAEGSAEAEPAPNSDDAEPMLATSNPESAKDDFDLDAFLLEDEDAQRKVPKPKSSKPRREDDESEEPEGDPVSPPKKARKSDEDDGFSISRGPDVTSKSPKSRSRPDDDEADEAPAPVRRPPGTNPNAQASNIASDLLSKSAKKGKKTSLAEIGAEKKEEEQFDWEGFRREVVKKALPIVVVGIVLVWGLFKLVSGAMGSKTFVPPLGQVTGTLTVNAKPLVGAEIWFYPENPKIKSGDKEYKVTASQGRTDAKGHYELTYLGDLKGGGRWQLPSRDCRTRKPGHRTSVFGK